MKNRKIMRKKSAEFVKALVERSKKKAEPAQPHEPEKDTKKIKQITGLLKQEHAEKKGIRSTRSN
ncbi:hypothetical protein GF374_00255 [Candidatus Woesearchaeota archaeon]|nr:hypothetical protein [Candidatus Woesearchaeota archaeon]